MRLIDAEELFNKVGKIVPRNTTHYKAIGEFMNMITNSLTIEPKRGEWIEMYRNGFGNMICMCSKCSFHASKSLYCPNCGARMI